MRAAPLARLAASVAFFLISFHIALPPKLRAIGSRISSRRSSIKSFGRVEHAFVVPLARGRRSRILVLVVHASEGQMKASDRSAPRAGREDSSRRIAAPISGTSPAMRIEHHSLLRPCGYPGRDLVATASREDYPRSFANGLFLMSVPSFLGKPRYAAEASRRNGFRCCAGAPERIVAMVCWILPRRQARRALRPGRPFRSRASRHSLRAPDRRCPIRSPRVLD